MEENKDDECLRFPEEVIHKMISLIISSLERFWFDGKNIVEAIDFVNKNGTLAISDGVNLQILREENEWIDVVPNRVLLLGPKPGQVLVMMRKIIVIREDGTSEMVEDFPKGIQS